MNEVVMEATGSTRKYTGWAEIQLALIRIYIGVDFFHHFAEKFGLLGERAFHEVLRYFTVSGFSESLMMVAGLLELAACICFVLGLFMRWISVVTAIYLIVALFMGYHYLAGFTWANHLSGVMIDGTVQTIYGGWEFPLFWAFMCLTFVLTGGRKWSVDAWLRMKKVPLLSFFAR
jgi:putative oxidoreductase